MVEKIDPDSGVAKQPLCTAEMHAHAGLRLLQWHHLLRLRGRAVTEHEVMRDAIVIKQLETSFLNDRDDALDRFHAAPSTPPCQRRAATLVPAQELYGQELRSRGVDFPVERSCSMSKLRRGLSDRVAGFFADWSIPRQMAGEDVMAGAAKSRQSRSLRPRLEQADRVGTSICPFCAVGCAQLVYARHGKPIHIEGDPRSPVNQGTLCPKGAGTLGMMLSEQRVNHVLYRAPHSDHWERRPLEWAMERIAQRVKQSRDQTFVERQADGALINHTLGIGSLGGATLDNEENYLMKKLFGGGLGMVSIENQARI